MNSKNSKTEVKDFDLKIDAFGCLFQMLSKRVRKLGIYLQKKVFFFHILMLKKKKAFFPPKLIRSSNLVCLLE